MANAVREGLGEEFNFVGQRIGPKGRKVRDNLLQAAREVMLANPTTIPTMTAVTAAAGVKITSVYRYYPDVNSLLVDAMRPMIADMAPAVAVLDADWPKGSAFDRAFAFSGLIHDYWRERMGVLFVRNSIAEMGDPAFVRLRLDWARPLLVAIAGKLGEAHGRTPHGPLDLASARILLSGLERNLIVPLQIQSLGTVAVSADDPGPDVLALQGREAFARMFAALLAHDFLNA